MGNISPVTRDGITMLGGASLWLVPPPWRDKDVFEDGLWSQLTRFSAGTEVNLTFQLESHL